MKLHFVLINYIVSFFCQTYDNCLQKVFGKVLKTAEKTEEKKEEEKREKVEGNPYCLTHRLNIE